MTDSTSPQDAGTSEAPGGITAPACARPEKGPDELRALAHWVYTNNPFYALSAALMFAGLRMSFDTSGSAFQTGVLLVALVAYTLLLAGSAWFLIRYGSLWEDVRTLLLVIVLMLLAISVSFDDTLATDSWLGVPLFIGGLIFASGLSEIVLRAIRLRLAAGYRLPFHAMMALFFLYPVILSQWIRDPQSPSLYWGLFSFSSAAGGVFLSLLPAIRRGPGYASNNGSPWGWPWYPWVLFGVLGFGVCVRAYYLCVSFHFVGVPRTVFAPYFLVPFFWVTALLLLEAGLVAHRRWLLYGAQILAAGLLVLAMTALPNEAFDLGFLKIFHGTLGASPLFLTLVAVNGFYGLACTRRVPGAAVLLAIAIAMFSVCGTDTFNPDTLHDPWGLPLLVAAMVLLAVGIRQGSAFVCLVGGWCATVAVAIDFCDWPVSAHRDLLIVHGMMAVTLVVGFAFRDAAGMWIQRLGAASLLGAAVAALACDPATLGDPPHVLLTVYPLMAGSVAWVYGLIVSNAWFRASAIGCFTGWVTVSGWGSYQQARRLVVGLDYIVSGIAFFVVAMLVSLSKSGFFKRR